MNLQRHIFIIGSKGVPACHGGFETFVENLTANKKNRNIQYHIACVGLKNEEFTHNSAHCFKIKVPQWLGSARAVLYDILAVRRVFSIIKKENIKNAVLYVLASRIGLFLYLYKRKLQKLGVKLFINPDGLEFKRKKYNALIKLYWKISENFSVRSSDLVICDSKCIQNYIQKEYAKFNPKTKFIAYGADTNKSKIIDNDSDLINWYEKNGTSPNDYYLVVGRFVPENNFKTIVKEFENCDSKKKLIIISNAKSKSQALNGKIVFAKALYNGELLKKIRENAFAYIHGHEVGGTNPSLLEAMASTKINLLLDVCFNREVAENAALYWTKKNGSLTKTINEADKMQNAEIESLWNLASSRVESEYNWSKIVGEYENECFNSK
jgi:rhamnosyltransferase